MKKIKNLNVIFRSVHFKNYALGKAHTRSASSLVPEHCV